MNESKRPLSGWSETHIGAACLRRTDNGQRFWSFGDDAARYGAWGSLAPMVQDELATDVSDWMDCDIATAREALAEVMV